MNGLTGPAGTAGRRAWPSRRARPPPPPRPPRPRRRGRLVQDAVQRLQQALHVDGLGQVGLDALGPGPVGPLLGGVRAENDHRDVTGRRAGPEFGQHGLAGHVGQVQVEQEDVRPVLGGQVERHPAEHRGQHGHRRPLAEDLLDQPQVLHHVLDVQHGPRGAVGAVADDLIALDSQLGHGHRLGGGQPIQNVLPSPGVLLTPALPPMASVRSRTAPVPARSRPPRPGPRRAARTAGTSGRGAAPRCRGRCR